MAVGTISSPAAWYNGTIAPASWFQNVQDTVNNVYSYKSQSRYLFVTHMSAYRGTAGHWPTSTDQYAAATANLQTLFVPIPLSGTSSTVLQEITEVKIYCTPAGVGVMNFFLGFATGLAAGAPTTGNTGTVVSSGAGYQVLTITPSANSGPTNDKYVFIEADSAASGDRFYGARIKFDNALYL